MNDTYVYIIPGTLIYGALRNYRKQLEDENEDMAVNSLI